MKTILNLAFLPLSLLPTKWLQNLKGSIERRNMRIAMRQICLAQAWLEHLGYKQTAESLERPIMYAAIKSIKPK